MLKGGYQIIDLKNHNHSLSVGVLHEGIYDKIEGTRKVIMLSGIQVEDVEYHDTFIFPTVNGTNYVAVVGKNSTTDVEIIITITDTDVVTFTNKEI